jgi:hypothetical protein
MHYLLFKEIFRGHCDHMVVEFTNFKLIRTLELSKTIQYFIKKRVRGYSVLMPLSEILWQSVLLVEKTRVP